MGGWDSTEDNGFDNSGFGNSGFGGGGGTASGGGGGFGGGTSKSSRFETKSSFGSKNVSFGGGNKNSSSNSSSSNPRPTSSLASNWKPAKLIRDFEPVGNLNKMIGVHNIPFFGQTQAFMGKTLWDYFKRSKAHFSDIIDRLNCHIVPMFLMFFVMLISANIFGAFGMEPMRCLRSPELNEEEREYALDYCQSKNTYYVAPEEGIPWSNKERRDRQLGYYHWVPIMMFLQAMLFMLPNWLWNALNQHSGIEYVKFIEESCRLKALVLNDPDRTSLVRELSERMSEAILNRETYFHRRMAGCRFGHSMGSYVSWLYVFIKLLYLINVSAQFWILNAFIGVSYRFWGLDVMKALLAGENWQDSPIFPRLTLCDVPIRRLGDTPRYTLQCHLRINTYNEKIYLFIWWGFLLVACMTFCNFCYYLFVLIFLPCTQENSVRHLLKQDKHETIVYSRKKQDRRLIKRFAEEALAKDGVLLFWFIESHAGPIVAREVLGEIFDYYKTKTNYEDDPSEIEVVKKGKGSFSSQSTGSLDDDEWNHDGVTHRFGNGGVQPSAPPKFGELASFASSQERDLIDGDGVDTTESTELYSSTPKHPLPTPRASPRRHRPATNNNMFYSDKERRRHNDADGGGNGGSRGGSILSRIFRSIFGGGNGNNNSSSRYNNFQHQPLTVTPFSTASYYGRSPVKNV